MRAALLALRNGDPEQLTPWAVGAGDRRRRQAAAAIVAHREDPTGAADAAWAACGRRSSTPEAWSTNTS